MILSLSLSPGPVDYRDVVASIVNFKNGKIHYNTTPLLASLSIEEETQADEIILSWNHTKNEIFPVSY
jgi:hypothetical protein